MAAPPPRAQRRRARRGTLERPVNGRMYRGTWLLVGVPLLIASFTVARPAPLPAPTLPPTFDGVAAAGLARQFATEFPNREPGSPDAPGAADWVADRFEEYGFTTSRQSFTATIPGLGSRRLQNVLAIAPASRSPQTIVVMAHRDATSVGTGVNDNASGTAALIELARAYGQVSGAASPQDVVTPDRRIVFLSTDGGAFGALGADYFAEHPTHAGLGEIVAVINLDAVGGTGPTRVRIAGDEPRSPPGELVRTATTRVLEQTQERVQRPGAVRQLLDLGFPFALLEQGPFVGRRVPAITLTTVGDRPPPAFTDTGLNEERLTELGRAAQSLLTSLDDGLELTRATPSAVHLGSRVVRGWAIQLVLITSLLPFLAAAVDLFARCRRRRIALAPALRSYRSRLGFWLFVGGVFALFAFVGVWPDGEARPPSPDSEAVRNWPLLGLGLLGAIAFLGWLVSRERLLPRRVVTVEEDLAGYTAALLVLGVLSLLVVATNPFALVFILPSLHAWLWLPQVRERAPWIRVFVLALGFAGPVVLVASFATRFALGVDAPWYLAELVALGYVDPASIVIFLAWLGTAGQLAALTVRRYAPYPRAAELPPRGPLREIVRTLVLALRSRRRAPAREAEALEG